MPPQPAPGDGLVEALFSTARQRILSLFFGQPERSFFTTELISLADIGTGAVQRELLRLEKSGLVTMHRVGNQKHYQANPKSPIFEELRSIIWKTTGIPHVLWEALALLAEHINVVCSNRKQLRRRSLTASSTPAGFGGCEDRDPDPLHHAGATPRQSGCRKVASPCPNDLLSVVSGPFKQEAPYIGTDATVFSSPWLNNGAKLATVNLPHAIQQAFRQGHVRWRRHALERLMERGLSRLDVKDVVLHGRVVEQDAGRRPFPVVIWYGRLDAKDIHAVVGYDAAIATAYVITVYLPDPEHFEDDMMTRRS